MDNETFKTEADAIRAINTKVKEIVCNYINENGDRMGRFEVEFHEGLTTLCIDPDWEERKNYSWVWDELPDGNWKITQEG